MHDSWSSPTRLIHLSCGGRTGISSIHKWKKKQLQWERERHGERLIWGFSQSRTIKSKCISCFDPDCNLHLCSANTFTTDRAYWIILTVCGSGQEGGIDRKWHVGWKVEWWNEKWKKWGEVKTERRAKILAWNKKCWCFFGGGGWRGKGREYQRWGGGKSKLLFPPASCTSSIAARQAVLSLSQQDLNWGPSL